MDGLPRIIIDSILSVLGTMLAAWVSDWTHRRRATHKDI